MINSPFGLFPMGSSLGDVSANQMSLFSRKLPAIHQTLLVSSFPKRGALSSCLLRRKVPFLFGAVPRRHYRRGGIEEEEEEESGSRRYRSWRRIEDEREGAYEGWEYERTWRDWLQDNRKPVMRVTAVSALAGGYYWYHLEPAPITGRRRFMGLSSSQENSIAESSFQQIMSQYQNAVLPPGHPAVRHVEKVTRRILEALPGELVTSGTHWRVFVLASPETANAFVLPGGEIFVFTGIFPVAQSEAGLATILGHEIAHQIARHGAEKLSFYQFFSIASRALQFMITGDIHSIPFSSFLQNLLLYLPFSRKCESEADYIGMLLMAKACYDPQEAVGLWERMHKSSEGREPPAFISTHPSTSHRIKKIQEWMPKAMAEYENAGCNAYQQTMSFWGHRG